MELGGRKFKLPVVPANMKTVVDEKICLWLAQNGYFYVMHRFDLDNVAFVRKMKEAGAFASISVGVKPADYDTVDRWRPRAWCPSTSPSTSRTAMPTR
jgi:GMP reductase